MCLVAFHNSAGGLDWFKKWNLNESMDNWWGIKLNSNGCVTCIDMDGIFDCGAQGNRKGNNLIGTLNDSIYFLSELSQLNLEYNKLTGILSPDIGKLKNLLVLNFGFNQFSGRIPYEIGTLPNLYQLNLKNNNLTGTIPGSLGNIPLQILWLENNDLSGCFNDSLRSLCNVCWNGNFNNPKLPYSGGTWTNWKFIFCGGEQQVGAPCNDGITNTLNDTITQNCECKGKPLAPCANYDSIYLISLYHSTNGPNWINKWNLLTPVSQWYGISLNPGGCVSAIQLNNNNLVGVLPDSLFEILDLEKLELSGNLLSGSISNSINQLRNLKLLDLSNNLLNGSVPPDLGDLCELKSVFLNNNRFIGSLPMDLVKLYNLDSFNVNGNFFESTIPPVFSVLCSINYILFNDSNQLNAFQMKCSDQFWLDQADDSLILNLPWLMKFRDDVNCDSSFWECSSLENLEIGLCEVRNVPFIFISGGCKFLEQKITWVNLYTTNGEIIETITKIDSFKYIKIGILPVKEIDLIEFDTLWHCLKSITSTSSANEGLKIEIKCAPNPVSKNLICNIPELWGLVSINVFDLFGINVLNFKEISCGNVVIDFGDLRNGMYIMEISNNKSRFVTKILKSD
ncbi:MAG: T9SS type A sorting domain-containing protein [Saprospiraceae bacterium]|nr:T9SS type A sorting domain-containing protein [Saprospiraceae bacterium]MBK8297495.1 T9SS type A sorting domain-containing protein [Saprospiraceae bacterium]